MDKDNELTKDKVPKKELAKEPVKDSSKEKGASQGQVLVLATLPFTTKEDPKGKGIAQAIMFEAPAQIAAKANPLPPRSTQDFFFF